MHYAITGMTATEIICKRADSKQAHMGLTSWKNGAQGMVRKDDVSIVKNYLTENEILELNLLVSSYLNFAELQAKRGVVMAMQDWVSKLDEFLTLSGSKVLQDVGERSALQAKTYVEKEFDIYHERVLEGYQSDFDRLLKDEFAILEEEAKVVSDTHE